MNYEQFSCRNPKKYMKIRFSSMHKTLNRHAGKMVCCREKETREGRVFIEPSQLAQELDMKRIIKWQLNLKDKVREEKFQTQSRL
jgi:hypothetical protein